MLSKVKTALLDAAAELFGEYNVDDVTIQEICERAGVSEQSFYYHFKNKTNLILFVGRLAGEENTTLIAKRFLTCKTSWEQVLAIHLVHCDAISRLGYNIERAYYARELAAADSWRESEDFYKIAGLLSDAIERAQADGYIGNRSLPDDLAYQALMLAESQYSTWTIAMHNRGADRETARKDLEDRLVRAFEVLYDAAPALRRRTSRALS